MPEIDWSVVAAQGMLSSSAVALVGQQGVMERIRANREGRAAAEEATRKEVLETPEDMLSAKPSPVPPRSPGFERLAAIMEGRWVEEYGVELGMWHGPPVPRDMLTGIMMEMEGTQAGWGHWSGAPGG